VDSLGFIPRLMVEGELWGVDCGLWAVGCGLWAVGCRVWGLVMEGVFTLVLCTLTSLHGVKQGPSGGDCCRAEQRPSWL
jgi:hypothetical protein